MYPRYSLVFHLEMKPDISYIVSDIYKYVVIKTILLFWVRQEVCNYDRLEGRFYFPKKSDLQKYRILVTTLVTAGRLVSLAYHACYCELSINMVNRMQLSSVGHYF